jgi:hypothetical protein
LLGRRRYNARDTEKSEHKIGGISR